MNVYSGNTISFGVTDRSLSATSVGTTYPAFKLEFFKDSEYKDQYVSSQVNKEFEVVAIGTVGTTNFKVGGHPLQRKTYWRISARYVESISSFYGWSNK